jgi:1-acyl-sn-glycerol-3-phosphate acyltransferase
VRVPPYHWWRTVFFLIPAISVYTLVLGAVSIVSSLFDERGYFAHRCARAWSWLILTTTGVRVTVEGRERIAPGAIYIFVSNHQSIYDTPVIFWSLDYQLRIIAKESWPGFRCSAGI